MLQKKSILFLIFILLSVGIYFFLESFKEKLFTEYQDEVYLQTKKELNDKFSSIYSNNYLKTIETTKELLDELKVKEFIYSKDNNFEFFSSNNRYIKIYDKDLNELYTNLPDDYTKQKGYKDIYIKNFTKDISDKNTILIQNTGVSIQNILPLFDQNNFIGVFETRIQFDEIVDKLEEEKIKTVFLLNSIDSKYININLSHSRQYLNNYYVINKNADKYYLKILEQSNMLNSAKTNFINKKDGYIIVKKEIFDAEKKYIADAYLIKVSDDINFDAQDNINSLINLITLFSIFVMALITYILSKSIQNKYYATQNEKLLNENATLKTLSDKLDYNEKKLSNLFNLQPNIMFISNGVSIVQVNKRFMGFFRRFKTFENFKRQHNNIADLFEPCEMPYYINDHLIDGIDWLEYILENPKRLYKTIMSVDGEQHHFIIKVNEMEYVRNFNERYIVVAFVDITQDIKAKSLEQKRVTKHKDELDLTYVIEDNIRYSIHELTNIIPTKQAIFKANKDEFSTDNLINLDLEIFDNDIYLKWKLIIPAQTISYISNIMASKFDEDICEIINSDINESAYETIDLIIKNIVEELKNINNNSVLKNVTYKLTLCDEIKIQDIKDENLYDFLMFLDNYPLHIMIDFDKESLPYIKQVQMLGMIFD